MTDDARALRERLETATGERISVLEGIGEAAKPLDTAGDRARDAMPEARMDVQPEASDKRPEPELAKSPEPKRIDHDLGL